MRVVQVIPDFGLGGVQKAGCLLGESLARRGHEAWVVGYGPGPRQRSDSDRHLVISRDEVVATLERLRPDIVHLHASNYEKANPTPLLDAAGLKDAVVVVTPVFGRPPKDRSLLPRVKTCCVGLYTFYRLLKWLGWSAAAAVERGVTFAPLTPHDPPESGVSTLDGGDAIRARREEFGVPVDALVLGRIGRATPGKWHPQAGPTVDRLLERFPFAAWLSIGMPNERGADRLAAKWPGRFVNLPETPDYERICRFGAALDLQLFMSFHGECFASSICDLAGLGVPTLALSTPTKDNGQAEQVMDGVTGFLLGKGRDADAHVERLHESPAELEQLKKSTRDYALQNWHTDQVAARVEQAYTNWASDSPGAGPLGESIVAQHAAFAKEYRSRVVGLAADGPVSYAKRYAALMAAESHTLHSVAKRALALVRKPRPKDVTTPAK
ncbi:MAG: hypothetical protein AAGJ46_11790 [Planctomycetota bacterium]